MLPEAEEVVSVVSIHGEGVGVGGLSAGVSEWGCGQEPLVVWLSGQVHASGSRVCEPPGGPMGKGQGLCDTIGDLCLCLVVSQLSSS